MALVFREAIMAKNQLKQAAKKIGAAMGKADRTAHKVAKAGLVAKQELVQLSKQVESLKRQLQKTTKRLRSALS
jgi:seryl-tRNA synthetase